MCQFDKNLVFLFDSFRNRVQENGLIFWRENIFFTFIVVTGLAHHNANAAGGKDNDGYHLYDIYPDGSITDTFDFVSSGSGSVFAYGVLENNYNKDINIEDGKILVSKAVNAALQRDSMSGGGLTLFTITESGVTEAVDKQVSVDVRL